ncbi:hypothetical protein RIF29_05134 [Crotalaria pallida]|uniref:DUF4218 domain-containing protein n=1 Tax=Crotalaria pallida TaxID=3830 RepID=A0AAN9P9L5_CROPI
MYPVERYLGHLKSLVRNKAQPEGSIAQGYLAEEICQRKRESTIFSNQLVEAQHMVCHGSCSHAPSPVAGSSSHDPPQVSPPQLSPHSPSVDPAFSEPFSQVPSQPTHEEAETEAETSTRRRKGRVSTHYWSVDTIDGEEHVKKMNVKVKDIHNLPPGTRVIVEFDDYFSPIGEAAGLLAGVCGQLATNTTLFPISFDKWPDMPDGYFDSQWNVLKALCERNRLNRQKQTIPHTCGAKSLLRRRHDLKIDTGNTYGRGPMWQITHKYVDGNYVNEEAQEKGDKIDEIIRENPKAFSEISSTDPVGVVMGKEHPGYARGMGM